MVTIETHYLVDYENVHGDGLAGCAALTGTDHILIFFTENACNLNMSDISDHGDATLEMKEVPAGNQSADMHIVSYLGYLTGKYGKNCKVVIVSKDTDFDPVIHFWKAQTGISVSRIPQIKADKTEVSKINNPLPASAKKKTELNSCIQKILSKAGYPNGIISDVASTTVKNLGVVNGKQQTYRAIISKYGQERGLEIYNRIKKQI